MIDITAPIHIDEIRGGWKLRREGADPIATFRRRDEALALAQRMLIAAGGGTIVVGARDGGRESLAVADDGIWPLAELGDV